MGDAVDGTDFGRDAARFDLDDGFSMDSSCLCEAVDRVAELPAKASYLDAEGAQVRYWSRHVSTLTQAR